jgi:hypothetical protein
MSINGELCFHIYIEQDLEETNQHSVKSTWINK